MTDDNSKDIWFCDDQFTGGGDRLVLRTTADKRRFFFRWLPRQDMPERWLLLGTYSRSEQVGCLTLQQARTVARTLSSLPPPVSSDGHTGASILDAGSGPLAPRLSVEDLCRAYAQGLRSAGKYSGRDVENLFARFIDRREIGRLPAGEADASAFSDLLRDVITKASARTACRLRSALHAAYAHALAARFDPAVPMACAAAGGVTPQLTTPK